MDIKRKIYEEIEAQSSNYGTYHKCLFHLHTYASHDYAVLQKYKDNNSQEKINTKITHEEIINLCKNNNLLPQETFSKTVKRVSEEYADTFNDEEELLVYLLIVWELIRNKYELVVVTDHNTIRGYNKLLKAKKIMRDYRDSIVKKEGYKYPSIILGIEISCADKNHVVGVFDDSKENIFDKINSFIKESVMTEVLGTFKTSLDVLKTIESIGGIGYIAHMNSSPMISKKDKFLSGGYTNKLLRLKEFSAVGLHNITQLNNVQQWINQHTDKEFAYVIDSDSHAVDTIKDNYFWIKGQKCNYQMIEEAIRDYNIAIRYEIPHPPKSFIKGIYLKNVGKGFLLDYNKNESLTLQLSSSLNCIIGGRGTGKSTLLNIIALILGQSFLNESVYNALCDYDELWLLFRHEHCDYLVNFMPRKKQYDSDDAFQDLNDVLRDRYRLEIHNHNDIQNELYKKIILKDCIYVYSIDDEGNICDESTDVLNEFFDRSYSVNELVKTASSDEINQYISEMMGLKFDAIKSSFRSLSGLNKFISRLDNVLDQRKNT